MLIWSFDLKERTLTKPFIEFIFFKYFFSFFVRKIDHLTHMYKVTN
jgi:hypothetical protein